MTYCPVLRTVLRYSHKVATHVCCLQFENTTLNRTMTSHYRTTVIIPSRYNLTLMSFCQQHLFDRQWRVVCERAVGGIAPAFMALFGIPLKLESQVDHDFSVNGSVWSNLKLGKYHALVFFLKIDKNFVKVSIGIL